MPKITDMHAVSYNLQNTFDFVTYHIVYIR